MPYSMGYIENPVDDRDFLYSNIFRTDDVVLEDYIDYEDQMPPIRNQGARGSCVAHGCLAVLEWQQSQFNTWWHREVDLSEEMLYRMIAEPGGGAFPRNAMKALQKVGVGREQFWQYDPKLTDPQTSRYIIDWKEHRRCLGDAAKWRIGEYAVLNSFDEMHAALQLTGCFPIGMGWSDRWGAPDFSKPINHRPVLNKVGRIRGGHMIAVVGVIRVNGKRYWKIRNSWGGGWGAMGYSYMTEEALQWGGVTAWAMYRRNV